MAATSACGRDIHVRFQISQSGPLALNSLEELVESHTAQEIPGGFSDLIQDTQAKAQSSPPDPTIPSVYLLMPIGSDQDIWHPGRGRLSLDLYRCDHPEKAVSAQLFRRLTEKASNEFRYDAVYYLPFLVDYAYPLKFIPSPPVDICLRIDKRRANGDPYLDGHTYYTSNELRIPAAELAALLGPLLDPTSTTSPAASTAE